MGSCVTVQADITLVDSEGKTATDIAAEKAVETDAASFQEVVKILTAVGQPPTSV